MPKIIWCGNKSWDTDFPENTLPNNAKRIERPDNIFKSSMPYGILPLIFSYAIIYIKWFVIGERAMNPIYVPLGIILGLLLMPVHEVLHGVCYKKGQKVCIAVQFSVLCSLIMIIFIALALMQSSYIGWNYNNPELAVAGTILHGFEFIYVRLAPVVFLVSMVGIIFTYKKR